ncbi:MAG: UDP-3-O-(3-hydroxymyristoyl)glucosamine N-acyltransferase [Betaproteobacteria bacterium]
MYLRDLQARLGGEIVGEVKQPLAGVGTIGSAVATEITFLANPRYRSQLAETRAGAVIVGIADRDATSLPRLVVANPYACFARVAQLFNPPPAYPGGIHPTAIIGAGTRIAESASIAEYVSIGRGAEIGEGVRIGPGCVLGDGVSVGARTTFAARVTVYADCRIGARCIAHAGVVIGADGFGFAPDFSGVEGSWVKIPQSGRVIIGDDCEVGANTTIDRGAIEDTVIGNDVKLDNQIQVGHNCVIGDHTIIAGCVGIAGSSRIGSRVMIGGAAGILGHLEICDGAIVSAMTLVTKSITEPGTYTSSMPLMKHEDWLRNAVHLRRLDAMADTIKTKGGSK